MKQSIKLFEELDQEVATGNAIIIRETSYYGTIKRLICKRFKEKAILIRMEYAPDVEMWFSYPLGDWMALTMDEIICIKDFISNDSHK